MKSLKNNLIEVFLLLSVLVLIAMLFTQRGQLSKDMYIQTMIQIAIISIFLLPQFIAHAKHKNNIQEIDNDTKGE